MDKLITMTAYRRPDYTRQVLDALAQCEGIQDWRFAAFVEPGNDAVIELVRSFDACESTVTVNRERLGLNKNTYECISHANRTKAEGWVHIEDDTVPSPDALLFFDWAFREVMLPDLKSHEGHQITIAAGYNKPSKRPPDDVCDACTTRRIFTCWGWGTLRNRYRWMITQWCFKTYSKFTPPFRNKFSKWRREIYPALSRFQNIGVHDGANDTPAGRRKHRTPWTATTRTPQFRFEAKL